MKTLYISDLDGTLLDKNAKLSPRSAEIISNLIQNGLLFSVATARSQSCISILQQLDINIPCVQLNGVLIYDFKTKKYIDCTPSKMKWNKISSMPEKIRITRVSDKSRTLPPQMMTALSISPWWTAIND